ncbi:MAG: glycosyltransferase family 4 protein, partial [Bdellovibrionales bacterium]|nr:glycosyltransferase family 4 protein [Bdellovibrionales bacterium]
YLSQMMLAVGFLSRNLPSKRVFTYHMTEEHLTQLWFTRPMRTPFKRIITYFANSMDVIISPSKNLLTTISNKGINRKTIAITNPLALDFFQKDTDFMNQSLNEKFKDKFVVFYAGRLNPEKNVPLLIKALAELVRENRDVKLFIAGKGDQEKLLKNLVNELNLQNNVEFLGFLSQQELSSYYLLCNVFVLPSVHETQGMVAMEAMRFKKPIVVTKEISSAEELVDQNQNGFIVDAFNHHELKEKLSLLMHSEKMQKEMGEKGFQKTNAYNPIIVTQELMNVYANLDARLK